MKPEGRELTALGHEVRLTPKRFARRCTPDHAVRVSEDGAISRPCSCCIALNFLVRQSTMLVNALRAHMAEFGIIVPQGLRHVEELVAEIAQEQALLPALARSILQTLVDQLRDRMARVRDRNPADQVA